jgi:hypothetical protein
MAKRREAQAHASRTSRRDKARANAWVTGDTRRLKELLHSPPCIPQSQDREENTGGVRSRVMVTWLQAMERSLASNSSTLAVVDATLLLPEGCVLEELRSRGYQVVEP